MLEITNHDTPCGRVAKHPIPMPGAFELPENVTMLAISSRHWNGVSVDLIEYTCIGRVQFALERHRSSTRLGTKLEEIGRGYAEPRSAPDKPNPHPYTPRPMYIAPADMALWGFAADARYLKCAAVNFDANALQERLGMSGSLEPVGGPWLRFSDDRIWTLIRLLTDVINDADPTTQLYGDALITAIAAKLFEQPREVKVSMGGLSTIQLKDAMSYLDSRMPERVELAALAALAGLSQSHYCRAFKASTGLAPYQWQLRTRIECAKGLLLTTNGSLDDVAEATGFADSVHFGRTFRRMTGAGPAAWRKDRLT